MLFVDLLQPIKCIALALPHIRYRTYWSSLSLLVFIGFYGILQPARWEAEGSLDGNQTDEKENGLKAYKV